MNISAHGHPSLSREQVVTLAECIASVDGISVSQAHRQIASFMTCDLHSATNIRGHLSEPGDSLSIDADSPLPMAQ